MNLEFFENPENQKKFEQVSEVFYAYLKDSGLDQDPTIKGLMDGLTIAQIKGLSRDDLEVLYTYGFNLITSGELAKAEDVFINLCVIDPLEGKNHYCLGVIRQMKQDWIMAIEDFSRFLAMDATNPEGYLRIAECLRATNRIEECRDVLDVAMAEARKGNGPQDAVAQVERALSTLG